MTAIALQRSPHLFCSKGQVILIYVSDGFTDFQGWVNRDADLDGTFELLCEETGEVFRINGWQACELEVVQY